MLIMKRTKLFSVIGVSVVGGVSHNAGQIICACLVMENAAISSFFPPLIITGTLAGVVVGVVAALLVKRLSSVIAKTNR